jgi:histidinol phosphatase-like PHP family hydrolase
MAAFQAFARAIRSPFARIGLEVDLYGDGQLLLAPEDAGGWDILLGGIHVIAGVTRGVTPQAEAEKRFMRDVEAYLASPVQVLAHLFRFFPSNGYQKPEHLYTVLADRLAATGKAAELNFHGNEPEPPFFRACLERGVKIALGTDSHSLSQPGDLARHLRFLHSLGVTDADLPDVLFMR